MKPIKHHQLDCQTFADATHGKIEVFEVEDLTNRVPHVALGGASKSRYESPTTGKTIYVLERNAMYAPDGWLNDVWQFDHDFSIADAVEFLTSIAGADAARR